MTLVVGTALQENTYVIQQVLNQSDLGITYEAIHPATNQVVIIQTLHQVLQPRSDFADLQHQFLADLDRWLHQSEQTRDLTSPQAKVLDCFKEREMPFVVWRIPLGQPLIAMSDWLGLSFTQSASESISNLIGESIGNGTDESINEAVNEAIGESINGFISEAGGKSIREPISKSIRESINESVGELANKPINQLTNPAIHELVGESVNASNDESTHTAVNPRRTASASLAPDAAIATPAPAPAILPANSPQPQTLLPIYPAIGTDFSAIALSSSAATSFPFVPNNPQIAPPELTPVAFGTDANPDAPVNSPDAPVNSNETSSNAISATPISATPISATPISATPISATPKSEALTEVPEATVTPVPLTGVSHSKVQAVPPTTPPTDLGAQRVVTQDSNGKTPIATGVAKRQLAPLPAIVRPKSERLFPIALSVISVIAGFLGTGFVLSVRLAPERSTDAAAPAVGSTLFNRDQPFSSKGDWPITDTSSVFTPSPNPALQDPVYRTTTPSEGAQTEVQPENAGVGNAAIQQPANPSYPSAEYNYGLEPIPREQPRATSVSPRLAPAPRPLEEPQPRLQDPAPILEDLQPRNPQPIAEPPPVPAAAPVEPASPPIAEPAPAPVNPAMPPEPEVAPPAPPPAPEVVDEPQTPPRPRAVN